MDAEKYWREFLHSGKITDYMSYKNDAGVEKEMPGERSEERRVGKECRL